MKAAIRVWFVAVVIFLNIDSTKAGDIASFQSIGFSEDGRYYAFEQTGFRDGSGYSYSEIVAVDLTTDQLAPGFPVNALAENEKITLGEIREVARRKADPFLKRTKIGGDPGFALAWNPVSEVEPAGHRLVYLSTAEEMSDPKTLTLVLDQFTLEPSAEGCEYYPAYGFRLTQTGGYLPTAGSVVHEDTHIPKSRGCPNGYVIAGVITMMRDPLNDGPTVAIIEVRTYGFEGSDGRYMALPIATR